MPDNNNNNSNHLISVAEIVEVAPKCGFTSLFEVVDREITFSGIKKRNLNSCQKFKKRNA